MSENIKDILSDAEGSISQETLLKYLNGELSPEQQHEVEKQLLDNSFENDAMEGLQTLEQKEGLQLLVASLNRDLRKKLAKKKQSREQKRLKPQWLVYFSILILLIILVLVYLYLHIHSK